MSSFSLYILYSFLGKLKEFILVQPRFLLVLGRQAVALLGIALKL